MADFDLSQLQGLLGSFAPSEDDKAAAQKAAILQAAFSLLGTRKGQEWGAVGAAGQNAMQGYQGALQGAAKQRQEAMQSASAAMQLLTQGQAYTDDKEARGVVRGMYGTGASAGTPSGPSSAPAVQSGGPTKQSKFEQYSAMADALMQKGLVKQAQQYSDLAEKSRPQLDSQKTLTLNGQRVVVNLYKDGTTQILPDLGPDQEKAHFLDTGSQVGAVDPFTGKPIQGGGLYNKTVSPDAQLGANTTMRGQNMTDARSRDLNALTREQGQWETDLKSGLQINKLNGQTRPITQSGTPVGTEDQRKKATNASGAIAIIDQAAPIIKEATGSYVGAGVDMAAQAIGYPTKGAQATAKLQALEGALMLNQPRMEGPQSDKDTAMYRQMAAKIGDPTVPQSTKLAALAEIRKLHERYQAQGAVQNSPTAAPKVVKWSDLP